MRRGRTASRALLLVVIRTVPRDGRLGIDNDPAERAVRPIGIGHRYRLFAGCDSS